MQKKMELLAPAGNMDSLIAAISCGADAVYLGVGSMNARAHATNFTLEELENAVFYAHIRNVAIYVTLNTLVLDREMNEVLELVSALYERNVDALIVQDIGLVSLIHKYFPDFQIHASTQMTIVDAQGANAVRGLGVSRVVLARELSLADIKRVQSETNIELEVFVHGAMCVCISGQCLHSSFVGARSGNRGQCAQPCRMSYSIDGMDALWLSMKDLCLLDQVKELRNAGVCSLKIEGRMKRKEYVAAAVSAYRKAIDQTIDDLDNEKKELMQIFNRGSFSQGYFFNRKNLIEPEHSGHKGVPVGAIDRNGINLFTPLQKGDEIAAVFSAFMKPTVVKEFLDIGKHDIKISGHEGDTVWRLSSSEQLDRIQKQMSLEKKIPVSLHLIVSRKNPVQLTASSQGESICVFGESASLAQNAPLTEEKAKASLIKLGETSFELESCEVVIEEDGCFIPSSGLNALRRNVLEQLSLKLSKPKREKIAYKTESNRKIKSESQVTPKLAVQVATILQGEAAIDAGADIIYAQPRLWNKQQIDLWDQFAQKFPTVLALPPVLLPFMLDEALAAIAQSNHFRGFLAGNIGQIQALQKQEKPIFGDYTFNITNRSALLTYLSMGLENACLSVELTIAQIRDIIAGGGQSEVVVYGKLPMMNLFYCPIREANHGKCKPNCDLGETIVDRKGERIRMVPITIRKENCLIQTFNPHSLDGLKGFEKLLICNAETWRMIFTEESATEVSERVFAYKTALQGEEIRPMPQATMGHFARGFTDQNTSK